MESMRLNRVAAGPAQPRHLAALIAGWVAASWLASLAGLAAVVCVLAAGVLAYWLILPKGATAPPLPRFALLPLVAGFVVGMAVPMLLGWLDPDLLAVGYGVWFVLWLQLGFWLRTRYGAAPAGPAPESPAAGRPVAGSVPPPSAVPAPSQAPVSGPAGRVPPRVLTLSAALLVVGVAAFSILLAGDEDSQVPSEALAEFHPPGTYPPAPSTAGPMSEESVNYAMTVDRICASTFNESLSRESAIGDLSEARGWPESREAAAVQRLWAANQATLHDMVEGLGSPPAKAALVNRWLDNVERRGELYAEMADASEAGRITRGNRIWSEITGLKARSDEIGQSFGLRICTSN